MKIKRIIFRTLSALWWTAVALLLLVLGAIQVLYSDWYQDELRSKLVSHINATQDIKVTLDKLSIDFPINVTIEGLSVVDSEKDTLIAAKSFNAYVNPLPLMKGEVSVENAFLRSARYRIGHVDSAQCINISANKMMLYESQVLLNENAINLSKANLEGGRVDMIIKEDTTTTSDEDEDSTKSKPWHIKAQRLNLKDFAYSMSIESSIDSLGTHFGNAYFEAVDIDMDAQKVKAKSIKGDCLNASYIASASTPAKSNKTKSKKNTKDKESSSSQPWIVEIDTIDFTKSKALYTTAGVKPSAGIDFGYLQVDNLDLAISSFYNKASEISLNINNLNAEERCGVKLRGHGEFVMDSDLMQIRKFDLRTNNSHLKVDGSLGMDGDLSRDFTVPLALKGNGSIAVKDIAMMFPLYKPMLKGMPMHDKITLDVNVSGSVDNLTIKKLYADVAGRANVNAKGYVAYVSNFDKMRGTLDVSGAIIDADFVNAYLEDDLSDDITLPKMSVSGLVDFSPGLISGDVKAKTNGGDMALTAEWNSKKTGYDVDLDLNQFPVDAFVPRYGVGKVSGSLSAKGERFDPFDLSMKVVAQADIKSAEYMGVKYESIRAKVEKEGNNADIELNSENPTANLDLTASCKFDRTSLEWDVVADVRHFDLYAFNLDESNSSIAGQITTKGFFDNKQRALNGEMQVDNVLYVGPEMELPISDVNVKAIANDSVTNFSLKSDDLAMLASTPELPNAEMLDKFMSAYEEINTQIKERSIDVEKVQQMLPKFTLLFRSGPNNLLAQQIAALGYEFKRVAIRAKNDSQIDLTARLRDFRNGTTAIDTLKIEAHQYGKILMYNAVMGNRPGTLDEFAHVDVEGYLANDLVSAYLHHRNIKGEVGYDIGALAQVGDSIVRFELFPEEPIIAYKQWHINDENFIDYNLFTQHIDADVSVNNAISSVRIYTEHAEHTDHAEGELHQEDIIVKVKDLQLSEWMVIDPDSPPMKGDVSADLRINWGNGRLNGSGSVALEDFFFGQERVGSFVADLGVSTDKTGKIIADATLNVDGVKTMTLSGALNDENDESPFKLDMTMIHFPLTVVNPLLPPDVASLTGAINGQLKVSGNQDSPIFNGEMRLDSASIMVDMIGTKFNMSNEKLKVVDNVISFDNYSISGVNNNPLSINGSVDVTELSSPQIDLSFKARNMQIIGSNKSKKADVYGKGYVDVDADVRGDLSELDIDATIDLLRGSNITYIIPDATSTLSSYNVDDMVKFVDFSDTTADVARERLMKNMQIELDAALIVSEGTTINVDLSTDGKNRVQLQGGGTINYSLSSMEDGRMTGRYTINKGFVRYTPPLMSEKLFDFKEGSYVAFNGDIMNPTLSLSAVDNIKANVTQEGQDSRLINFDVEINVTNTLNNMNVAFDLSTPDDITIANELASMSAEQRANQAMNMLLYNVYSGPGATANSNFSGNPLYAFVESKVNSWVANNVKFVDISFGIDQYDKTTDGSTSKTTSYSYKVSKTLFDDRFKIVVGGNYSTDADADENYSQNLINDISFEYMINKSGSMYVKLFRQVGYESILEGEVIQTGVGFVYKRKLKSLRDLFR